VIEWLAEEGAGVRPDFVLLDPPRAGAGREAISGIVRLCPPRIAPVACDPATLARDLRQLLDSGYAIRSLAVLDLFPRATMSRRWRRSNARG
jgi:23S rRNA (uracil1939-C5)-methyltransferase